MPQRNKWIRNAVIVLMAVALVVWVSAYGMPRMGDISEQWTCAANLKRLGEACAMYQTDWHDVLVPYGAPLAWKPRGMWPYLLDDCLRKMPDVAMKRSRAFTCPADLGAEEGGWPYHLSYGMNWNCGGWTPGEKPLVVPAKTVKFPSATIRIAEVMWEAQGGSLFAAKPSEFKPNDPNCRLFPKWHMGKGNVLWIDGHVSAMTLEQYNMRDKGPYDGNIWLRLEGPKPPP